MGSVQALEGRDAWLCQDLQFPNPDQPALLAEVAQGLGHGDPRHAGHFRELPVGEIDRFQGHGIAVLGAGTESLAEPDQQIEQACLRRPDAGELQQHPHLLDVGCGAAMVLGWVGIPLLHLGGGEGPQLHGLLGEELGNHGLSGAPDAQGEHLGLIGEACSSENASIHTPTDMGRQGLTCFQRKLQASF